MPDSDMTQPEKPEGDSYSFLKDGIKKMLLESKKFFATKKGLRILLVGYTGSGKTTLIKNLFGVDEHQIKDLGLESTKESDEYLANIEGQDVFVIDTPGNEGFFGQMDSAIAQYVDSAKEIGIVNVVSYGYNDSKARQTGHRNKPYLNDDPNDFEISEKFLQEQREKDLQHIETFLDSAAFTGTIKWVLTIVNKVELWSDHRSEMKKHYGANSEYQNTIFSYLSKDCQIDFCFACGEEERVKSSKLGKFHHKLNPINSSVCDELPRYNRECIEKLVNHCVNREGKPIQ